MSPALHEQGWIAPKRPGPRRRHVAALLVCGVLLYGGWGLLGTGWLGARLNDTTRTVQVAIDDDGGITVDGRALTTSIRTRGAAAFIAASSTLDVSEHRRLAFDVSVPDGADPERVVIRVLRPNETARRAELVITAPTTAVMRRPPRVTDNTKSLRALTDPFDARIRTVRDDRLQLTRLRSVWPWIAALGLVGTIVLPFGLWYRAKRRFFSLRLPGPGREPSIEPPSSLDPVGAAVLVAGAGPVDYAAAFAGRVLDLVERRQLPMRRSATTPPGLGTLIGLHHADEIDDDAVAVLRSVVQDDGFTVVLPDSPRSAERASDEAIESWVRHVDARSSFARAIMTPTNRILRLVAHGAGVVALASTVVWALLDLDGSRVVALLVAVSALALAISLQAWLRDSAHWRVVARTRRNERAQWLAWRDHAAATDGPMSDRRNLPTLVAVGATTSAMATAVSPAAVDLDAVAPRTIDALRLLLHGD